MYVQSSLIKELAEKCCTNIFREVPVETMRVSTYMFDSFVIKIIFRVLLLTN